MSPSPSTVTRAPNAWASWTEAATWLTDQFRKPEGCPGFFNPDNPGGTEWGISQPSSFEVWSYVYDLAGLSGVNLNYRVDDDGVLPVNAPANDTYAGGAGVGAWTTVACTSSDVASTTNPLPLARALRYAANVTGLTNQLVDYYIEATDTHGNLSRSPIQHVWVGAGGGGGTTGVSWTPTAPTKNDSIRIVVGGATQGASLHWGVNTWTMPIAAYQPAGTTVWTGGGTAVETPMSARVRRRSPSRSVGGISDTRASRTSPRVTRSQKHTTRPYSGSAAMRAASA